MIAIIRHPDRLDLYFIDDQETPLHKAKQYADMQTLNMLWCGEIDVLMVERPQAEPIPEPVEPNDCEFLRLMYEQKQQRLGQGAFLF